MLVKSKYIYSPQNYCNDFYNLCPIFKGEKDELQKFLRANNIKFKSVPLEKIHVVLAYDLPVVLVNTTYINERGEICYEYTWFTVPKGGKINE